MDQPTVTIAPHQHKGILAHLKAALVKTGHVSEEAAGAVGETALAAVILAASAEGGGGAFRE
jgi:hypothetical protein